MAGIAVWERRFERAASLFGYAESYFKTAFGTDNPLERHDIARLRAQLEESLRSEPLGRLRAAGAAWTEDEAMREALAS
jgi:hypothetical protein